MSDKFATGNTITTGGKTYTIIVLGDATGNGIVDSADLLEIQRHLIGKIKLTEDSYLEAADSTQNGLIDSADLLAIQRHLIGKIKIEL